MEDMSNLVRKDFSSRHPLQATIKNDGAILDRRPANGSLKPMIDQGETESSGDTLDP